MISVFDALKYLASQGPVKSQFPKTMEDIGQSYGFILYRVHLPKAHTGLKGSNKLQIHIDALHDRSVILVDQVGCFCSNVDNQLQGAQTEL